MDIEKQYNLIGKDYISGQKSFFSKREGKAVNFIKNNIPNKSKLNILDIGCGNGADIKWLELLESNNIYGIDSSEFMIEEAKKTVSNPKNLFIGNIEKTPFENNFFDIIVGRFSFHYLRKFDNAYLEMSRILKLGGKLILVVHHPFRDLMGQKNKVYGQQEDIKISLYDNKVSILFPTHTLKDYFSKKFFENFYLDNFTEEDSPEEYADEFKTPGFIGISAVKR